MITEITWTDAGWENFKDTLRKFDLLRAYYGDAIANEHEAEFYRTLQRVTFAAGPVNIQADGTGFYISFSGFVCGLVWTPDSDERLLARLNEAGVGCDACETVPANWPRTGRWSAHS